MEKIDCLYDPVTGDEFRLPDGFSKSDIEYYTKKGFKLFPPFQDWDEEKQDFVIRFIEPSDFGWSLERYRAFIEDAQEKLGEYEIDFGKPGDEPKLVKNPLWDDEDCFKCAILAKPRSRTEASEPKEKKKPGRKKSK